MNSPKGVLALVMAVLCTAVPLTGQIVLENPGLPSSETFVYRETMDDESTRVTETVTLKRENGRSYFEVVYNSPSSERLFRLDVSNLQGYYSETTSRTETSTTRRTTELIDSRVQPMGEEMYVADLATLSHTMRGFPWAREDWAKVVLPSGDFEIAGSGLEVWVRERETIEVNGRSYDTYKVEAGLGGFIGNFIPKSTYWFLADSPHYLVKAENNFTMGGGETSVLELISYRSRP